MSGCSALVAHAELAPCSFLWMPRFFAQRAIFGARAVAGFAAFFAHRSLHSRAVVSVVALRLERAFAIDALVFWTRNAQSAFVGRAAAFAAWSTFGC